MLIQHSALLHSHPLLVTLLTWRLKMGLISSHFYRPIKTLLVSVTRYNYNKKYYSLLMATCKNCPHRVNGNIAFRFIIRHFVFDECIDTGVNALQTQNGVSFRALFCKCNVSLCSQFHRKLPFC